MRLKGVFAVATAALFVFPASAAAMNDVARGNGTA